MKPGTQIAYIPTHAQGNIAHPDVEFGFVTSMNRCQPAHFCRFWRKGKPGELRTVANSELTPDDNLIEHESVEQAVVDELLIEFGPQEPPQDHRIFNRRQPDGTFRPITEFFDRTSEEQ